MKPCRKQPPAMRPMASSTAPVPITMETHRYTHPIRTTQPTPRSSTEELLAGVLETLSRHSDLLEELLRRTDRDAAP